MADHTPGPWNWLNYPDGRKLLCGPSRAIIHCPDAPITILQPDAHLIAAAPELRAACEAFLAAMMEACDQEHERLLLVAEEMARAAIARAEGPAKTGGPTP